MSYYTSSIISQQCEEVREIVRSAVSSSSGGIGSSNTEQTFLNVCMKYDKSNLDPGESLGIFADRSADKKLVETFISASSYDHSELYSNSHNGAPCSVNSTNNNKWIWEKGITNGTAKAGLKETGKYANTIGIPPRTQSLCLGNLKKIERNDIYEDYDNSYLLLDWIIAAKLEGEKLAYQYKTNSDKNDLCKALGYSYADYGDLIKGTSIWENYFTNELETNLEKIFKTVFNKYIQQNGKTPTDPKKYPNDLILLRETWWNTNKKYILAALIFGAEQSAEHNGACCVSEMKNSPPTTDYIPQFLRFAQEWVEHFCEKRKTLADNVISACYACKHESEKYHRTSNVDKNGTNVGADSKECWLNWKKHKNPQKCKKCKNVCDIYKVFLEKKADRDEENKMWRERWKQMEEKYTKLIDEAKIKLEYELEEQRKKTSTSSQTPSDNIPPYMIKCNDNHECIKPDSDSFYQYLAYRGITTLSSYMNMVLKDGNCGDDKPRWDRTTVLKNANSGKTYSNNKTKLIYPELFGDRPAGYKYACECRIPSREELCRDNHMYNTRWVCGQISGSTTSSRQKRNTPSGQSTYELCNLKHEENDEEDKTTTRSTSSVPPGVKNLSDEDIKFFNLFDLWYKDIQDKLDRHFHRISRDCKLENIGTISSGGSNEPSPECLACRDSCECYKLWVKHMKDQWETQQSNYEQFNAKQQSSGQSVSLNDYLFTRCWAEYFEKDLKYETLKDINPVEDINIINVLRERCGDNKEKGQDKFQERIEKAEKQTTQCHKKQERCKKGGEQHKCENIKDAGVVNNCKDKYYDGPMPGKNEGTAKSWDCEDKTELPHTNNVCMSPRTQQLCVANMASGNSIIIKNGDDINTWKDAIQAAMKKETENLYEYYEKGKPIISKGPDGQKGQPDSNGMPQNFCLAVERTYNDFKHMVLGDSISKHTTIKQIGDKIKSVLPSGTTPEKWWDEHSDKFWDAIKCGIQQSGKKSGATGNECGEYHPDNLDSQFVWWFKEWAQQFCVQRQTYIDAITKNCSSSSHNRCNGSGKDQELKQDCKKECEAYKGFIEKKKDQWTKQKNKYETEHPGMEASQLFGEFPECEGANFEAIFDTSGKPGGNGYRDAGDICSCKQQTYTCNKNESTCQEKSGDVTTWRTHLLKIGKDNKKLEGVYAPPRRQKLCLANLHPMNFGKDKSTDSKKIDVLNRLQMVAEREAYFLWKYYHPDSGTTSTTTATGDTNEDKKACCAIRSSFFDIGDIVKGTDLWDDPSKKYIDKSLNDIFEKEFDELKKKKKHPIYENPIGYLRNKWWEIDATGTGKNSKTNRDSIWDAMQCGVTNALKELGAQKTKYDQIDCMKDKDDNNVRNFYLVGTPQFVRWLEEWTQQFCEKYDELIKDVKNKCRSSGSGSNDCNDSSGKNECKTACTKYNDWITSKRKEWNGMSKYYEKILQMGKSSDQSPDGTDYHAIIQPTAIKHLNLKCKTEINGTNNCCFCQNIGKDNKKSTIGSAPLEHMDKVVNKTDDKYKKYMPQCTKCYIQHIKDQIKSIEQKIMGTKDQTPDAPPPQPGGVPDGVPGGTAGKPQTPQSKKEECTITNDILKTKNPSNDNKIAGCGGKHSSNKWDCSKIDSQHTGACMPPRRQSLCISNLIQSISGENQLREKLIQCASIETYWLWDKYKKDNSNSGAEQKLKDGSIPEEFKRQMFYTLGDFHDLIVGKDIGNDGGKDIKGKVTTILNGGKTGGTQKPDEWWPKVESDVWEGMLCALSYSGGQVDKGTQKKLKEQNKYEEVTFSGDSTSGTKLSQFVARPQFLRWITEWYDDYCYNKQKLYKDVETACKTTTDDFKCDDKDCKEKCKTYKDYMEGKKKEWEGQQKYYENKKSEQKSGKLSTNGYDENDAKTYLQKNFTVTCGTTPSSGEEVQKNIDALNAPPKYDVDEHCGCKKYINNEEYKTMSKNQNCWGLTYAAENTQSDKKIKWRNRNDNGYKFLSGRNVPEEVYLPPRKQNLCFKGFDGQKNNVKTEDTLRTQLMKVAATEGYNLGEYYKEKNENSSDTKYNYDVSPCSALKYSFYDLRDIILGYDMTEPKGPGTEDNLQSIFEKEGVKSNGDPGSDYRKKWWTQNQKCVWDAMLCGYQRGRDGTSGGTTNSGTDIQSCNQMPDDKNFPIASNRPDGMNLQFLRWFEEWGEDFCKKQTKQYDELDQKCTKCVGNGNCDNCDDCTKQCQTYQAFIQQWKEQYNKQKEKFNTLKNSSPYNTVEGVNASTHAYEYLDKALKKMCQNSGPNSKTGGSTDCNCMTDVSSQNSGKDMPKSLEETPDIVKHKCDCTTTSQMGPPPNPAQSQQVQPKSQQTQAGGQNPDTNGSPSGTASVVPTSKDTISSSSGSQFPGGVEPASSGSGSGVGARSGGSSSGSSSSSTSSTTVPPEHINCVEKAAYELQKEVSATNNINSGLKGTGIELNNECNKIQDAIKDNNASKTIDEDQLKTTFPSNTYGCPNEGTDRFKIGESWKCVNIGRQKTNVCIPPRREHMCIKNIENMYSSKIDDKNKLLKEVMEAAKNEGIDILKKLKPQKENEFYNICDAMKYSFADIGDIIRGRDLWNKNDKRQVVQTRLRNIFREIYKGVGHHQIQNKYNEPPNYYKLRSDWWDTNRDQIWKAMTCVAPDEAKFQKKDESGTTTFSQNQKCGHNKITPVDDYIPQRFRWLTEWSEYFCKGKKKIFDELKEECNKCEMNGSSCIDDHDGNICEECKETCKSYSGFVQEWKEQFDIQAKTYNELYDKENPSSSSNSGHAISGGRRNRRNDQDEDNKRIVNFLKQVKNKCGDEEETAEKYLDKANNCKEYKFDNTTTTNKDGETYAFKEQPPNGYEDKCECKAPDPLEQCPDGNTNTYVKVCENVTTTNITCYRKKFNNDLDHWKSSLVRDNTGDNKGVLLPPRRKELCTNPITKTMYKNDQKDIFKKDLLTAAYNEGTLLGKKYKGQPTKALQAMKYSFYDYGDIIKGTDMVNNTRLNKLSEKLDDLLKNAASNGQPDDRKNWWDNNKKLVWHAMLCGYKEENRNYTITSKDCNVPDSDKDDQFLRWMTEWSRQFCEEKEIETISLEKICLDNNGDTTKSGTNRSYKLNDTNCLASMNIYKKWIDSKNEQWNSWKNKYEKNKNQAKVNSDIKIATFANGTPSKQPQTLGKNDAEEYVRSKCNECNCKINNLNKMYDQIQHTNISFIQKIVENVHEDIPKLKPKSKDDIVKYLKNMIESVKNISQTIDEKIYPKETQIKEKINTALSVHITPSQTKTPTQNDESSDISLDHAITYSTLPVKIGFLLGSAALIYFYLKKKPILRSTNLFRVIDIPQNDYGIPDKTSTNRYVPYASNRYKGKTYIYVEGEETHDYVRDISSSDITSSSESEYEEIDINDIYPYKSPKYKTLIEVVLKPSSNTYDTRDNHIDHMENTQDTHHIHMDKNDDSNKITDNEWNSLKNDFISNILQNTQMGLPNENTTYDDMYKDIQPDDNILRVNKEEKPFISEIQDRDLHNKEHFTYNINRNVPEKINRTTSSIDDLKYFSYNLYSGTDLINDSLNGDQHVDIYDELLKRKENELFGKKTSTKY
ncbi:erythrocyte membrane protein 1, PfEMP1, putative [Plasmodium gaboni]|uniref:Erythrocyte membrane protein 1, PfEMP1, putative n=1 Tax=Plasmodium gaboni TaxID=647221 RepID=A0ABY1UR53_9APIC|nr:erythrocyte membrane protein 1, PfEMP1, putative [Plasmodium gaboni]